MAQLSVADLLARGVPLSSGEAVALTLAVSAAIGRLTEAPVAVPGDEQILLSSTGEITLSLLEEGEPADEAVSLAALLHRLLRLDESASGDRRGRAPGALLVVLARTMRQIDLPPLAPAAFRDALARFTGDNDPAALAAVFWRAARMRPRSASRPRSAMVAGTDGSSALAAGSFSDHRSGPSGERRLQGTSASELRRALRQTERELFTMRRPPERVALPARGAFAAVLVAALVIGLFSAGSLPSGNPAESADGTGRPGTSARTPILVDTASRRSTTPPGAADAPKRAQRFARPKPAAVPARVRASAARSTVGPKPRPRTVDLVNLPRSTWAVVR